MKPSTTSSESHCARERRNTLRNLCWTAAWVLSQALAVFGPKFLWSAGSFLTWLAVVANLLFGVGMIWAFVRWLADMDELQKRIQLESLAIAVGVGVVGGLNFSLFDMANLITFDAEIGFVVILMALSYLASIAINTLRYR